MHSFYRKLIAADQRRTYNARTYGQRNGRLAYSFHFRQLREALADKGCTDCGAHGMIHFHHLEPEDKSFAVSRAPKDLIPMLLELNKCVPLCPVCHRARHAG